MINHRSISGSFAVVLVTGFCLAPAVRLAAERAGSLTEQQIEVSEAKTAMETLTRENNRLKAKLEQSETTLANTQKNLTNAMSEAEEFRRKASELKVRLEALGLEGAGGNIEKLQQRLLRAVSDLKLAEDERKKLKDALIQLSETILTFKKSSVTNDPEALEAMEAAMRSTAQALGVTLHDAKDAAPVAATLQDGMVLSMQEELALVVANLGSRQGVKVGMPFQVLRNGNVIGTVRVVDVRESIAGAVIQDLSSEKEKIKQGDRLKVDARQ
jgi:chromosome segregation ATPase